jgi:flagellar biosynthesis GTPase FlhF
VKKLIQASKGLVIDGTWSGFGEESNVPSKDNGGAFANLLIESRRVPEIVIVLKCKEDAAFKRLIDADKTKAEFDKLMEARAEAKTKQRGEDRVAKLQETEDALKDEEEKSAEEKAEEVKKQMEEWEEAREAQEAEDDENDAEKPNLEEMLEKHREGIRTQREADEGFLEEFTTTLRERGAMVIDDVKTDTSANFVFVKLNTKFQENF